ncbi:cyclin-like protein, partial [Aureobasidium melanogenum]
MPPSASSADHLPPHQPAARQRPKSPDRVLAEAEAQWLFTEQELLHTPSVRDGMSPEKEKEIRAKGVNFIRQVGIMLKLPELTLSTAAIFFNRFLMRVSLVDRPGQKALHHYTLGATALFLATKVEESCRKMKDLVVACCRVAQKNPNLLIDEQSKDFWKWRDTILLNEDVLLEMLCFDLTIEAPHKQLYEMLKYYQVHHNKQLRNAAWAFVTDSNITQLCLLCSSHTIAAAALYSAARYCNVAFPDSPDGRPWWHVQHVSLEDILKACNYMAANYEHVPIKPGHEGAQTIYAITSPSAPILHQEITTSNGSKIHHLDPPHDDRAAKKRRTSDSATTATSVHPHEAASRTVESHGSEEGEVEG